jgi:hypothetical protein
VKVDGAGLGEYITRGLFPGAVVRWNLVQSRCLKVKTSTVGGMPEGFSGGPNLEGRVQQVESHDK